MRHELDRSEDLLSAVRGLRPDLVRVLQKLRVPHQLAADLVTDAALQLQARVGLLPGLESRLLRSVGRAARWVSSSQESNDDYTDALESVDRRLAAHARRLEAERAEASELAQQLANCGEPQQRELLASSPCHTTRAIAEHLLTCSQRNWIQDAQAVEPLADLALQVLAGLDPAIYGTPLLNDLEALAWTSKGNARRILYDLRRAEEAFAEAEVRLARGTGDPRERATLLLVEASLRRAQRRFDDALRLLDQARAIHRWTGDRHQEGRVLLSRASTLDYAGDSQAAVAENERAIPLLDERRDPRLKFAAANNLAHSLVLCGRHDEAADLLSDVKRLAKGDSCNDSDRARAAWLEARLAMTGDPDLAETLLAEVRDGFAAADRQYEAAVASLDLLTLYLEQGRSGEAKELAFEVIPVFQSRAVHREALAALIGLQRAFEMETATAELVREVSARVRNAATVSRPPEARGPS